MSDTDKSEWTGCTCEWAHNGVIVNQDMQGEGPWAMLMTYVEPCNCVSLGVCPDCGAKIVPNPESSLQEDYGKCSECDWTWAAASYNPDTGPNEP